MAKQPLNSPPTVSADVNLYQQVQALTQQCHQERQQREQLMQIATLGATASVTDRLVQILAQARNSTPRSMDIDNAAPSTSFMDAVTNNDAQVFAINEFLQLPKQQLA